MQVLIDKCPFASVAELIKEKELSSELLPVDNSRPDYPASLELGKILLRTLVVTSLEGGRIIRSLQDLGEILLRTEAVTALEVGRIIRPPSGRIIRTPEYPAPERPDNPAQVSCNGYILGGV